MNASLRPDHGRPRPLGPLARTKRLPTAEGNFLVDGPAAPSLNSRRLLMALGLLGHLIVRRWLVLVIVRLHVILAHRMILEPVPHQDASQVRMPVEDDPVEVVNLAFLEFRGAPERGERRQLHPVRAIARAHPQDDGPVLLRHR